MFSTNENIKLSPVYVGSLILKQLKKSKQKKVSIFEIATMLQEYKIVAYRHIIFALMFLHACDIIDFKEPYIYIK